MMRRALLIARTVWLEFLRRKEFYVLLILIAFFVLGILVVRIIGTDSPATSRFLMSFGLLLSYVFAAILTAATAARQLPGEMENRTIQPLLAKPVSRSEVVLGKSLAVSAVACSSLIVFLLFSWLPAPKLPDQSPVAFAQVTLLRMAALCVLGIFTIGLSLYLPTAVVILITLTTFFAAPMVVNFVLQLVGNSWHLGGKLVERVLAVVPDFSIFEHAQRYVQGASPIPFGDLAAILAYGIGFAALFYFLSVRSFNRMPL
jgi:ABC-type transport system involved in multi-copper enzyme maturation permease subunit